MPGIKGLTLLAAAMSLLATPALAERKKGSADPNRMVCEKQEVLGSRLQSKRVCMTAAEWALQRQSNRESIDRNQALRNGPNGN